MEKKSIGQTLRQAREARGLSLSALAATTRIPSPALDAMERDEFGDLPADVYVRGFVRAYCRAVELPEGEQLTALDAVLVARREAIVPVPGATAEEVGRPFMPVVPLGEAGRRRIKVIGAAAAALVLAALIWFLR